MKQPDLTSGKFAVGVGESEHCELVAVGSRSRKRADSFGDEHKIQNRYGAY